ncbi:MAG: hypothetical protein IIA64_12225 [Planctomycetes bacterium]|nr:hypothetical protein [Planctomycetota bacterium]
MTRAQRFKRVSLFLRRTLWRGLGRRYRLKQRSRFQHTFFVGYCNGALGYFPTIQAATEGGYGAASATRVEVGAGERLVNRALINLYYQADKINP